MIGGGGWGVSFIVLLIQSKINSMNLI